MWQCAIKNVANHRGGSQCFGPGPARPPNPFTFIDRPWASPAPQTPHFYRQGPGQPGPPTPHFYRQESLTFIDGARPARPPIEPLTSIGQTPHFYWPDPSLLSAKPARPNPKNCEPPEPPVQLLYAKWQTLIAHCHVHQHDVLVYPVLEVDCVFDSDTNNPDQAKYGVNSNKQWHEVELLKRQIGDKSKDTVQKPEKCNRLLSLDCNGNSS